MLRRIDYLSNKQICHDSLLNRNQIYLFKFEKGEKKTWKSLQVHEDDRWLIKKLFVRRMRGLTTERRDLCGFFIVQWSVSHMQRNTEGQVDV